MFDDTADDDQELVLRALVDGELDAANILLVEAHVARCEGCRGELERLQAVRNLLGRYRVRHQGPEGLVRRMRAIPELSVTPAKQNRVLR